MEEKIKLSDLLGACLDFKRNPTEERKQEIEQLVSRFQIASYLPLKTKQLIAIIILNNCTTHDLNAVETEFSLMVSKTIYGVLSYVVNLDNDLDFAAFNIGTIDMLYEFGIVDEILSHCQNDYKNFEQMLKDMMHYSNVFRLSELSRLMTEENIDKFRKTIEDIDTELTPEKLEELKKSPISSNSEELAKLKALVIGSLGGSFEQTLQSLKTEEKKEDKPSEDKHEEA